MQRVCTAINSPVHICLPRARSELVCSYAHSSYRLTAIIEGLALDAIHPGSHKYHLFGDVQRRQAGIHCKTENGMAIRNLLKLAVRLRTKGEKVFSGVRLGETMG